MKNVFIVIVVLFTTIIGCQEAARDRSHTSVGMVPELEKIRLTDLENQPINLKQFSGKTIFINFWATWCNPCIKEMSSIQQAQELLKNEKLVFLMASNETAEQIQEFANRNDYTFNYVRVDNSEELNIQALPTTFIFNAHGKLTFSDEGYRKWNDKKNIDLILKITNEND